MQRKRTFGSLLRSGREDGEEEEGEVVDEEPKQTIRNPDAGPKTERSRQECAPDPVDTNIDGKSSSWSSSRSHQPSSNSSSSKMSTQSGGYNSAHRGNNYAHNTKQGQDRFEPPNQRGQVSPRFQSNGGNFAGNGNERRAGVGYNERVSGGGQPFDARDDRRGPLGREWTTGGRGFDQSAQPRDFRDKEADREKERKRDWGQGRVAEVERERPHNRGAPHAPGETDRRSMDARGDGTISGARHDRPFSDKQRGNPNRSDASERIASTPTAGPSSGAPANTSSKGSNGSQGNPGAASTQDVITRPSVLRSVQLSAALAEYQIAAALADLGLTFKSAPFVIPFTFQASNSADGVARVSGKS